MNNIEENEMNNIEEYDNSENQLFTLDKCLIYAFTFFVMVMLCSLLFIVIVMIYNYIMIIIIS